MITLDAILLGGGQGTRFLENQETVDKRLPKQFQVLGNAPVFIHALKALLSLGCFRQIVLVMPKEHIGFVEESIDSYIPSQSQTLIRVVAGGDRRQDSSYLGLVSLEELNPPPTRVLIHDACRPFLSRKLLENVKACLLDRSYGAWVPVVPVVDTLKKIENKEVIETVDRNRVHRVQTPQIFEYPVIHSLYEKVKNSPELTFYDDASLCEYFGIPVGAFEGDVRNIKLTYGFELQTLQNLLNEEQQKDKKCELESATTFTV